MTRFAVLALALALLALCGCKKSAPPDDNARLQGEWQVTAADLPPDLDKGEAREVEQFKDMLLVVEGDRATVTHAKEKGTLSATFSLDPTKAPAEIDLTNVAITDEAGRPEKIEGTARGIYRLTGDELVLALALGEGGNLPRPTEFKPMADKVNHRGVLVFHLKKK